MKTILVIDDDIHISNVLEEILVKEGYKVIRAQNRQQAANHHPVIRGAGILRQLRQGLTQMAQRQQQRPRGGQQGKPHPAAVGE